MAVSFVAVGAWSYSVSSVTPAEPTGTAVGDYVIITLASKYDDAVLGGAPSGWDDLGTAVNTGRSTGNDNGNLRTRCFGRVWQSGDTMPTLAPTPNNVSGTHATTYRSATGAYSVQAVCVADDTTGSPLTSGSQTLDCASGDFIHIDVNLNSDVATFGTGTLTTAATESAASITTSGTTTSGTDMRNTHVRYTITAGTASTATYSMTLAGTTTNAVGSIHMVRLREAGPAAINASPSAIASSETFGSPTISVTGGAIGVVASGIATGEAFADPALTTVVATTPTAIATEEVFGSPTATIPGSGGYTNQHPNPSWEVDDSHWQHASSVAPTLTRVNTDAFSGSWSWRVTSNNAATANTTVRSPLAVADLPVTEGDTVSVGIRGKWVSGTPRSLRCDLRWMNASNAELATQPSIGTTILMTTSDWVLAKSEGLVAPVDAVGVRLRVVALSTAQNDSFLLDGAQAEWAATLPEYNDSSTGGGGAISVTATGIATEEAHGPLTVATTLGVIADGIATAEAHGSPTVSTVITASPTAITSAEALGSPTVSTVVTASPTAIFSAEALGSPTISTTTPSTSIVPTAIASAEVFGSPAVSTVIAVTPTAITSTEVFGSPNLSSAIISTPTAITSAEAFGSLTVSSALIVSPTGVVSSETFGITSVFGQLSTTPVSIASSEVFGLPSVSTVVDTVPTAIATTEAFGTTDISFPSAGTNQHPNPSFEIDTQHWIHASAVAPTLTRVNTDSFAGSWALEVVVNNAATANTTIRSILDVADLPVTPGETVSIGVRGKWVSGTPKTLRCDVRWMDASNVELASQPAIGTAVTMSTTDWVLAKTEGVVAPAGTAGVRMRIVSVSDSQNDTFLLDGAQVEFSATLPAYNEPDNSISVVAGSITSEEAFGSPSVSNIPSISIAPTSIASAEVFGTPSITHSTVVTPDGIYDETPIPSGLPFPLGGSKTGNPTVSLGAPSSGVTPSGIPSAEAFGTVTVTKTIPVIATGVATGLAFGTTIVTTTLNVTTVGISTAQAFGSPTILNSLASIPNGIASGEVFGSPTIQTRISVVAQAIATAEAFGNAAASYLTYAAAQGIASGEAFGSPTISLRITVSPTGVITGIAIGTPVITAVIVATPTAIVTALVFGNPSLTTRVTVTPTGIASAAVVGMPTINGLADFIGWGVPIGLVAQELPVGQGVVPTGIATQESFGTLVANKETNIAPTGIATSQTFGATVITGKVTLSPSGTNTGELFGSTTVTQSGGGGGSGLGNTPLGTGPLGV